MHIMDKYGTIKGNYINSQLQKLYKKVIQLGINGLAHMKDASENPWILRLSKLFDNNSFSCFFKDTLLVK